MANEANQLTKWPATRSHAGRGSSLMFRRNVRRSPVVLTAVPPILVRRATLLERWEQGTPAVKHGKGSFRADPPTVIGGWGLLPRRVRPRLYLGTYTVGDLIGSCQDKPCHAPL